MCVKREFVIGEGIKNSETGAIFQEQMAIAWNVNADVMKMITVVP